jgi:hypothetical protein
MIGNIVNLLDESFPNDLSANEIAAFEDSNSVMVAQGKPQCNYHYFKSFFKFITLLTFLGMDLRIKC